MNLNKINLRLSLFVDYQKFVIEQNNWLIHKRHNEQMADCKGLLVNFYERCERLTFNQWLYRNGHDDLVTFHDTNYNLDFVQKFYSKKGYRYIDWELLTKK